MFLKGIYTRKTQFIQKSIDDEVYKYVNNTLLCNNLL